MSEPTCLPLAARHLLTALSFFDADHCCGCKVYSIYKHMLLPLCYEKPGNEFLAVSELPSSLLKPQVLEATDLHPGSRSDRSIRGYQAPRVSARATRNMNSALQSPWFPQAGSRSQIAAR